MSVSVTGIVSDVVTCPMLSLNMFAVTIMISPAVADEFRGTCTATPIVIC